MSPSGRVYAVDEIKIDYSRSKQYLPYEVTQTSIQEPTLLRRPVPNPIRLYRMGRFGEVNALAVEALNGWSNRDEPASLFLQDISAGTIVSQIPLKATIDDFQVCYDPVASESVFVVAFERDDSAFVLRKPVSSEKRQTCFLATGLDQSGDTAWRPNTAIYAGFQSEPDGQAEVILHVRPARDLEPRILFCIDLRGPSVRWSLPLATIIVGQIFPIRDPADPQGIFVSCGPDNGVSDGVFDDQYGYLTVVSASGQIVGNWIVTDGMVAPALVPASDSTWYLFHTLPLIRPGQLVEGATHADRLSIISAHGDVLRSVVLEEKICPPFWFSDYDRNGSPELYALSTNGRLFVFSSDLNLLAASAPTNLDQWQGTVTLAGERDSVFVFSAADGLSFYSHDLRLLATTSPPNAHFQPLAVDRLGRVLQFAKAGAGGIAVCRIRRRTFVELARIAFWEYQSYVLMLLSASLAAVVVVNFYRRRTKRNLILIASHKSELERVHDELRRAQATIIAQEKYRQARDIAGAFAHEIRNALFPAEAASRRLSGPVKPESSPEHSSEHYAGVVAGALRRALALTEQISHYTRLEGEHSLAPISLRPVIDDVLTANRLPIEENGAVVTVECSDGIEVMANLSQLRIVLNNLLLNSLDALTGRPAPAIRIGVQPGGEKVDLTFYDNGAGISADALPRIFDAFFSTKPAKGTGLGLAVVKRIVELSGGTIAVESEAGKWTKFTLRLAPGRPA